MVKKDISQLYYAVMRTGKGLTNPLMQKSAYLEMSGSVDAR